MITQKKIYETIHKLFPAMRLFHALSRTANFVIIIEMKLIFLNYGLKYISIDWVEELFTKLSRFYNFNNNNFTAYRNCEITSTTDNGWELRAEDLPQAVQKYSAAASFLLGKRMFLERLEKLHVLRINTTVFLLMS